MTALTPGLTCNRGRWCAGWFSFLTCAEQQQDLHAQILVVGNLQPDKLAGNLQHLLTLVGHVGQLHPLPGGFRQKHILVSPPVIVDLWGCLCSLNQVDESTPSNTSVD